MSVHEHASSIFETRLAGDVAVEAVMFSPDRRGVEHAAD